MCMYCNVYKIFLYNSQNSDTYKLMPEYLLLSDRFILIDAWHCEALITTASDENTIRPAHQILYLYSASKFAAPGDIFGIFPKLE